MNNWMLWSNGILLSFARLAAACLCFVPCPILSKELPSDRATAPDMGPLLKGLNPHPFLHYALKHAPLLHI